MLTLSNVLFNYAMFAYEYKLEKLIDELEFEFSSCLLQDISIVFILNRYVVSFHKPFKLNKFGLLRRTGRSGLCIGRRYARCACHLPEAGRPAAVSA